MKAANQQAAEAAAVRFGVPVRTTAASALQEELDRTAGHIAFLAVRVGELGPTELTWGNQVRTQAVTKDPGGRELSRAETTVLRTGLHPWYSMLLGERRHYAEVAKVMEALGLEAKALQLGRDLGDRVADALEFALGAGGLTGDDRDRVIAVFLDHLPMIEAVQ